MAEQSLTFSIAALDKASSTFAKLGVAAEKLEKKLDSIDRKKVEAEISVNTKKAAENVGAFARKIHNDVAKAVHSLPDIELNANSSDADRKIAAIKRELSSITDKQVGIGISTDEAQRKIQQLSTELMRVANSNASVRVRADAAKALADLGAVQAATNRLDGQRSNVSIVVDGARALNMIGLVVAGLGAVAVAAGPAIAALAAVGNMGSAALQAGGAMAAGLSGISDAVGDLQKQQTKVGQAATNAANLQEKAANRQKQDLRSIEDAQASLSQATIQYGRAVRESREANADAVRDAQRAESQATRDVTEAQERQLEAVQALTKARQDYREEIEDTNRSLRSARYDEEEAVWALQEAEQSLAEARKQGVSGRDLRELEIAYGRAQLEVENTKDSIGDLQRQQKEAFNTVKEARKGESQAARDVQLAESNLRQVREDNARTIARVERQSQERVADAARAVAEANRNLIRAQNPIREALKATGAAGSASAANMLENFNKLGPAGRKFARYLNDEMIPTLHGIRDGVQNAMLPKLETSLRNLESLAPMVTTKLAESGDVIGDLAIKGSEMMTSGPFRRDFKALMEANNQAIEHGGNAGLYLFDALRNITSAAIPLQGELGAATEQSSKMFAAWIQGKRNTGELRRFFDDAGESLNRLWENVKDIVIGLWDFAQAAAPVTQLLLNVAGGAASAFSALSKLSPTLTTIFASTLMGTFVLGKLGTGFATLSKVSGTARSGLGKFGSLLSNFIPTVAYANLEKFRSGVDRVGSKAATLTTNVTGSATAGGKMSTAFSRAGKVLSGVGAAIPILGLAVAGIGMALSASSERTAEWSQKLEAGGDSAKTAYQDLMNTARAASIFSGDVAESFLEQYNALTPLAQAQVKLIAAEKEYGANSVQYKQRLEEVAAKQRAAKEGTDEHTASIRNQQDAMLGISDAQIGYEQAWDDAGAAIKRNGKTLDLNTQSGRDNRTALNRLTAQGLAYVRQLQDQKAPASQVAQAQATLRKRVWDAAYAMTGSKREANRLTTALLGLPKNTNPTVGVKGVTGKGGGLQKVSWLQKAIDDLKGKTVKVGVELAQGAGIRGGFFSDWSGNRLFKDGWASGGFITGPGTGTSDSILARLSNGEFVMNAKATENNRGLLEALNSGKLKLPAFAAGGAVGKAKPTVASANSSTASASGVASISVQSSGITELSKQTQELTNKALVPLTTQLNSSVAPALQKAGQQAGGPTANNITKLTKTLPVLRNQNAVMSQSVRTNWQQNTNKISASTAQINNRQRNMQAVSTNSWRTVNGMIGNNVNAIRTRHFNGLQVGMTNVRAAMQQTAGWARAKFNEVYRASAEPTRATIRGPFNRGIIPAWNFLHSQFNIGKKVGQVPLRFATGGKVPGQGSGDTVPSLLTPGEYVIPKKVVKKWGLSNIARAHKAALLGDNRGLEGLFSGDFDQLQGVQRYAKGGVVADTGSQMNAALARGNRVARSMNGKPYIWGGASRAGADCSGYMSIIHGALANENPYYRRYSTASFAGGPTAGFVRGLRSGFAIGVSPGSHMAGTLTGTNVESGGSHGNVAYGGPAVGADHSQFSGRYSLPFVGGAFASGGGGGGMFDPTPIVNDAFRKTYNEIRAVKNRWPGNTMQKYDTGIAKQGADKTKAKALAKISASMATSAGAPGVAGSPEVVAAVKAVAAQFGWASGPQWAALNWLIGKESSWNPRAANPTSSARGLFQKMTSIHGPVEPTVAGQAQWGLNYIRNNGNFHDPIGAMNFHKSHNWYDRGGLATGKGLMYKGTVKPERVLSPQTTKDFTALVDAMTFRRGAFRRGGDVVFGGGRSGPVIEKVEIHPVPGSSNEEVIRELGWEVRQIMKTANK